MLHLWLMGLDSRTKCNRAMRNNATDADVRYALGFPKHPLHKIVCIGALVGSRQPEGWRVDALGAPHIGERPETKLISDFVEGLVNCVRNSLRSTGIASIYR